MTFIADLPRSIGRVLCCPVYVLTVVGGLTMMVAMMSISAFGPKYMENQFQIPTWKANIIVGMVFPEQTAYGFCIATGCCV